MIKYEYKKDWVLYFGLVIAFIGFFVFFTVAHPLYIYDTDDWTYISFSRHAWPTIGAWNPTRILPETLMPLTAEIGIRFIMPFTGDYIGSMAIAFAIVLSIAIVTYINGYAKVLKKQFKLNEMEQLLLLAFLIFYHFFPFHEGRSNNQYMFYGGANVTCVFYYLIPGLINAAMVMYLMTHEELNWMSKDHLIKKGFIVLLLYLCINSNMFQNIILISYIGTKLLISFFRIVCHRKKEYKGKSAYGFKNAIKVYIKDNIFRLSVLFCWMVSAIIETTGGRATGISENRSFVQEIGNAIIVLIQTITGLRKYYLMSVFLVGLVALLVYGISKRYKKNTIEKIEDINDSNMDNVFISALGEELICLILTCIYLPLLGAATYSSYLWRSTVRFDWMFWVMLMVITCLTYIIKKIPYTMLGMPILVYALICESVVDGRTYADHKIIQGMRNETIKELDENIIRQVKEAEAIGFDSVQVLVPVHYSDEWPVNVYYGGERISLTLFLHGITNELMEIKLVPDQSINDEFYIPKG